MKNSCKPTENALLLEQINGLGNYSKTIFFNIKLKRKKKPLVWKVH